MPDFSFLGAWWVTLAWTLVTLGVSWTIGAVVGAAVVARVPRWLPQGQRALAQSIVRIVRQRLPWLALLVGAWLAAGYWPLTAEGRVLVERAVFVLGALSVTVALAAIASQSVDAYATVIAPVLPGQQPDAQHRCRTRSWRFSVILRGRGLAP